MAEEYRKLGAEWTAFAEFLLPKPFAGLKAALRKLAAGDDGQRAKLRDLGAGRFPYEEAEVAKRLDEVSSRLADLYEKESAAAGRLAAAVDRL